MNRYKNGWEKLPTQEISEDDNYIYYEAESPGFSIFAITGQEIASTTILALSFGYHHTVDDINAHVMDV